MPRRLNLSSPFYMLTLYLQALSHLCKASSYNSIKLPINLRVDEYYSSELGDQVRESALRGSLMKIASQPWVESECLGSVEERMNKL